MPWRRMGELEVSGQLHAPIALSPAKEPPVPIGYKVVWTPEPVWTTWRRENSWPYRNTNSDPSVVQLVASRYTDWAIPAYCIGGIFGKETISQSQTWCTEQQYISFPSQPSQGQLFMRKYVQRIGTDIFRSCWISHLPDQMIFTYIKKQIKKMRKLLADRSKNRVQMKCTSWSSRLGVRPGANDTNSG
jgi:hypothetical protein